MLLEILTATQLAEWEAFDRLDPVGDWRGDFHSAQLLYTINSFIHKRFGKRGSEEPEFKKYFPRWGDPTKPKQELSQQQQTVEEMKLAMQRIAALNSNNKPLTQREIEIIRGKKKPKLLRE